MNLHLGDLVTIENYRTGAPYKKYYGLLTSIFDEESETRLNKISSKDSNIIFCNCTVEWLVPAERFIYNNRTNTSRFNATYLVKYENV